MNTSLEIQFARNEQLIAFVQWFEQKGFDDYMRSVDVQVDCLATVEYVDNDSSEEERFDTESNFIEIE